MIAFEVEQKALRTMTASGTLVALWLALLAGAANAQQLAADLPPTVPAPEPTTAPSFQGYGDRDTTCIAWTDECRTGQRDGATVSCSNIGIACQPASIRCTTRQDGKQQDDKKPRQRLPTRTARQMYSRYG